METPSQDVMRCTVCKKDKPKNEMNSASLRGLESRCKACQNAYEKSYRDSRRERYNEYHRKWRAALGDKYNKYMSELRRKKIASLSESELSEFRRQEAEKSKRLSYALKNEVFEAYGGWVCACCGETERSFLTIDHMLNNGSKLRKEGVHGHSTQFYRWLKKSGYPKDFQVLCMNCQFGKRMNDGVCPHQRKV